MFKKIISLLLCMLFFCSVLQAGRTDLLIKKLMEKGVLTDGEAQQLLTLSKEGMRKELAMGKAKTAPKWTQMIKLKGDLRLRFQREDETTYFRDRARMRFRLKGEAKVCKPIMIGFGLATGSDDARSTNQTMEDTFATKAINLDYAYAKYAAPKYITLLGGKIPNKSLIWKPADLLWDGDISLEGAGLIIEKKVGKLNLYINSGYLILNHIKTDGNAAMTVVQPGITTKINGIGLKLAVSGYMFDKVKGNQLPQTAESNTYIDTGNDGFDNDDVLKYNYNCVSTGLEISFADLYFEKVALFAEGVQNPDPSEDNKGFLGGIKFGNKKIKKFGHWQIKAMYRELQKDAWLDVFPDSDFGGGETGLQGTEFVLKYGLTKNSTVGLDYYATTDMGKDKLKSLIQFDIVTKF
ncbi:putative porin [bacterium]